MRAATPQLMRSKPAPATGTVSVVATVLNEAQSIGALLDSLCRQTAIPDEVIIVDGGSADGTVGLAEEFRDRLPLRVFVVEGCTIAAGRNRAIETAQGEYIAVTDAGVRLVPRWLESLLEPLRSGRADVSSGFFVSDPHSLFELALGATTLPLAEEIDPAKFLPSSRSIAFRKKAWAEVGGYPEHLDYCEDLVFDQRLRRWGYRFAWVPEAVACTRPRPDLAAFFLQYYRYARGDGKAGLWWRRHAMRYAAYLLLAPGLRVPVLWPLLACGAAAYLARPLGHLRPHLASLGPRDRLEALAWVPVIRLAGDVAKMAGYPAGLWWRWRREHVSSPPGRGLG